MDSRKFLSSSDDPPPPSDQRYPPGKSKSCHLCDKQFRDVWFLKQHMRIHTGSKPFLCLICGRRSNRKSNLTQHIRTVHKNAKEEESMAVLREPNADELDPNDNDDLV